MGLENSQNQSKLSQNGSFSKISSKYNQKIARIKNVIEFQASIQFYYFHGHAFIIKMKSGTNQNVDYILVNLMPPASSVPCFEKAKEYRRLYSAAGRNENQTTIQDAFRFKTHIFKKYGSGVYLYFKLIQMLFYTFLIMTINTLPIYLSNFKGNGLKMYGDQSLAKSLMKLSLGNQKDVQFSTVITNQEVRLNIEVSQTLIVLVDMVNTIIFFIFLIFWKIKSDRIVEELISEDALPSYYTLQVRNLPPTYTETELKEHFQKFGGRIAEISTVYNYQNVLTEVKSLIRLVDQYAASDQRKKGQLYEQISIKLEKVRNLTKFKTPKPVIALVTFEDMILRKKIKDLYKYRICPRELRYNQKMLRVSTCQTEPSGILWQNYHLQIKVQVRQAIFISILLAFVLIVALLALFMANAHATSMIEKQSAFSTKFDFSKHYTFQEAKKIGTLESIFVFCSKLTYHNISLDWYYFCQPYFNAYRQKFSVMIGLSLLVITINLILNYIICQLAKFRRYRTKTEKSRFLILNIFALYFINSGLLMVLIRVQLGGYSLGRLLSLFISLPADQFSIESYSDFTRKWYINIGSQIVMIHAVSLLASPFIQIIINWLQAKYRVFKAKRAKTQFQMNQALLDSQFDFQTFYAMLLNACFFTLFYGNAIPILYFISLGAFFALYSASFIVFRYFSCRPVMFDHTLNAVISRVMCVALCVHQGTSLLYIYTEDIFPLDFDGYGRKKGEMEERNVLVHKLHQGLLFIFLFVFLVVCTVNYNRVCKIAKKYAYKYFIAVEERAKQPKLFSQIYGKQVIRTIGTEQMISRQAKSDYLSSYKMEDNPSYLNISYALKILSIFQPYFSAASNSVLGTSSKDILRQQQQQEKYQQSESSQQDAAYEYQKTHRPLMVQQT